MSDGVEISASNSWIGNPGDSDLRGGWNNLTVLAERSVFVLYTAIRDGRKYVIKALRDEYAEEESYRRWLEKECRIGLEIDHPGVVRVEGLRRIPEISRESVLVMEWIDGMGLAEFLSGSPSVEARRRVAYELGEALEYIHSLGVCHRDLKPDNIMVTRRGGHARIIDFGLGDAESFIEMKSSRGTRRYGAPEQLTDEIQEVDSTADVWAFGRLLADMHCGRGYKRLARRCMRESRKERPPMTEVVRSLERLQRGGMSPWAGVAVVLVAVAGVAAGFLFGWRGDSQSIPDQAAGDSQRVEVVAAAREDEAGATAQRSDTVWMSPPAQPSELASAPEVRIVEMTENEAGVDEIVERAYGKFMGIVRKYKAPYDSVYKNGDIKAMNDLMVKYNKEYWALDEELSKELESLGLSQRRLSEIHNGFQFRVARNGLLSDRYH